MEPNLATTNLMLGIMAAVSVLEALLLIGIGVGAFIAYRRLMTLANDLETRHVTPAMARINAILDDVKSVSATVKEETERVDHAIRSTIERVDDTADRVRSNVCAKTSRFVGVVRGARVAIETILHPAWERPRGSDEAQRYVREATSSTTAQPGSTPASGSPRSYGSESMRGSGTTTGSTFG